MAKRNKKTSDDEGMRTGEFGSAILQIAEEKGISKETVIETIEAALSAAYKKDYGKRGQHIRADFDEVSGDTKFFLVKEVVDETTREFPTPEEEGAEEDKKEKTEEKKKEKPEIIGANPEEEKMSRYNPERDILLEEAKKLNKKAKVGDIIETELETKSDFGRVAAQTAKQVIIQRIREAERDSMFKEYKEKEGEVINGTVQRIEGKNVFVDLGKSIGVLFPSEQIESERYRIGQRLKVFLAKVESDPKGPGIILSRTHPEIIRKLFALEVPEIFSGTVEIKAVAREAGSRTKIAVSSKEEGVDPIGSCVGQKGTRVQAVIDELGGEKIDIIEWNETPGKFISSALSPAKVLAVNINEENREATVKVPEDQLSLAIGKRGQNVRLAAKLTGWKIDVVGEVRADAEGDTQAKTEDGQDDNKSKDGEKEIKEEKTEEKKEEVKEKTQEEQKEKKTKKTKKEKVEDKKAE
jgi:transcription termination/antitermination protein NusA